MCRVSGNPTGNPTGNRGSLHFNAGGAAGMPRPQLLPPGLKGRIPLETHPELTFLRKHSPPIPETGSYLRDKQWRVLFSSRNFQKDPAGFGNSRLFGTTKAQIRAPAFHCSPDGIYIHVSIPRIPSILLAPSRQGDHHQSGNQVRHGIPLWNNPP